MINLIDLTILYHIFQFYPSIHSSHVAS